MTREKEKEGGRDNELLYNITGTVSDIAATVRSFGVHRPRTAITPASPVSDLCVPGTLCAMATIGRRNNCVPVPLIDLLHSNEGNQVAILHCEAKNPNSNIIIPHAVGVFKLGNSTGIFDPTYSQIDGSQGKSYYVSHGVDPIKNIKHRYGNANSLQKHLDLLRRLETRSDKSIEIRQQVCTVVGITPEEANVLDEKLRHLGIPSIWWDDCIPGGFMAKYGLDWSSLGVGVELAQKLRSHNTIAVDGLKTYYMDSFDEKGRSKPNTFVSQERNDLSSKQLEMLRKWLLVPNKDESSAAGTIYRS